MPRFFFRFALFCKLFFRIAKLRGFFEVLRFNCFFFFALRLGNPVVQVFQLGRRGKTLYAQTRSGFINQVDRFVRQVAILNVSCGHFYRRLNRIIGNGHFMMVFIPFAESFNCFGIRRFGNLNGLESALQSSIFFDMLAVLVVRCCAYYLQFAASQHGLEHIRRIHCSVSRSRADNSVNFVNKQNNVSARLHFFKNFLQTFLKVSAIPGAGNHRPQIERINLFASKRFRHIAFHDSLSKTFHDGSFSDARLAHKHGYAEFHSTSYYHQ